MFERLVALIKRIMPETDVDNVSLETRLADDLGFDSLATMMLAMEMEKEFKIRFNGPVNFQTVGDVIAYLEKTAK
ncbi:MAG TPA: acyl carrier protein [Bacilli bacterium]|nr:acyl carrier protein [Bacilli bacterium]HPS18965.1 acyl carrier protein [Bacilli bacterium]